MDIVERLNGYIAYNTKQSREEDDVMRDAAAEIERLRTVMQSEYDRHAFDAKTVNFNECGCDFCVGVRASLQPVS